MKYFDIFFYFFTFEVIICSALLESMGTSVSPKPQCLVVGGSKVNETCKFNCNNGYELPDPKKDTLACLERVHGMHLS